MDSLTHVVLGGCIGQVVLGKKIGRKAVIWGAIADTIPDLDVFANFFIHPVDGLLVHRGFTHSILFACLASIGLGYGLAKWYKQDGVSWKEWAYLMSLGLFTHLFIDSLTSYGTGLFEPFHHHRFSYTTLFIADPMFTFPMLFSFIVLLFKKPAYNLKYKMSLLALLLSTIYMAWTFKNRWHFEEYFKNQFMSQNIAITAQDLMPTPLNNILWSTVGKVDSGYYSGCHSLLTEDPATKFTFIPKNESISIPFKGQREYELMERFAKGYSCFSIMADGLPYFHDLRFRTATPWSDTIGSFTYKYPLKLDATGKHLVKHNPWMAEWEGSRGLWDKIMGRY